MLEDSCKIERVYVNVHSAGDNIGIRPQFPDVCVLFAKVAISCFYEHFAPLSGISGYVPCSPLSNYGKEAYKRTATAFEFIVEQSPEFKMSSWMFKNAKRSQISPVR